MQEIKTYTVEYYEDPTPKAIGLMCGYLLLVALSVWAMRYIHHSKSTSLFVTFIMVTLLIAIPVLAKKTLIKSAGLTFSDEEFAVKLFEHNSANLISEQHFLWQDISGYRPYFDSKLNTCITLYLKNKKRYSFIFKDDKTYEQAISQDSVFSNFHLFVRAFNQRHTEQKILPRCSFLATNAGKCFIWGEVALLATALFLQIMKKDFSHVYFLFIGAGTLIPQILNRKQNEEMYLKLSAIDNT